MARYPTLSESDKFVALVAAAGSGMRMGLNSPKQFAPLNRHTVLAEVCSVLQEVEQIDAIIIISPPGWDIEREYASCFAKVRKVVNGGATRQESVANGLAVARAMGYGWVVIHDAARPFAGPALFNAVMAAARAHGAAVAAWPCSDTVKRADKDLFVKATLPREEIWLAQTPQAFNLKLLLEASLAADAMPPFTDEAALLEHLQKKVKLVPAPRYNFKITTMEDLQLARKIISSPRIGLGFDAHRLTPGRDLVLAGVKIDYELGLHGHSDADVLTHALMDALLSAAGLGDIGRHFPDTDPAYDGISSIALLRQVKQKLEGFTIGQVNAVLMAQKPKIAPYIPAMQANWASALDLDAGMINIAATTTEGLGFIGRGEGMAAQAQVMLY